MRRRVILLLAFLTSAVTWKAQAASLTLDDFSTGPYLVTLRGLAEARHVQPGTMSGGFRHTHFRIAVNPLNRPSTLEIRGGLLTAESGAGAYDALVITYGVNQGGQAAPLNLDLSAYDRFRLSFATSDLPHNIALTVYSGGVAVAHGYGPLGGHGGRLVDFPFTAFGGVDFADVDHIVITIVDANLTGSSDFALTGFFAVGP